MKHKFRKYISKRGSALFMVLSVMTALIMTSMAMYFSVVSSRKTQYAIFNQQQSFQSALSLNESLLGAIYMQKDDSTGSGFKALSTAMLKLGVNETLTTSGNGFISFDETNGTKIDENQVGAYTADITNLGSVEGGKLFDVAVTAMINGTESIVHQYVVIKEEGGGGGKGGRSDVPLFVASGLIPTSSALNAGYMFSDVFYDSEYAHFMPYGADSDSNGNAELKVMGNVYAAGSLTVNFKVSDADAHDHTNGSAAEKPHTWTIRKDLIMSNSVCAVPFKPESEISGVYEDKTNKIIVGGNCIFKSNALGFKNCEIYVHGDLIIESGAKIGENVTIYVDGTFTGTADGINVEVLSGAWSDDLADTLKGATESIDYFDWNTVYGRKAMGEEKEYDNSGNPIIYPIKGIENEVTAHFKRTPDTPPAQFVYSADNQGCTIVDVDGFGGSTGGSFTYNKADDGGEYKLVIDTGDNPENVFYIRLKGNLDGGKTFSWCPNYGDYGTWVVVKGKGSVVFEVPDGVAYENRSYKTNVIHEDWLDAFGSQPDRDQAKNLISQGWIHYNCDEGCCVNEVEESTKTCGGKNGCGAKLYHVTCSDHSLDIYKCPNCDSHYVKNHIKTESDGKMYSYATCEYRVNERGGKNPNTNIFLVMTGQNSEIRFTPPTEKCTVNGINESYSSFWGYIYAPYAPLTYSAKLQSGDKTQFVGGIAVGNFNFYGRNTFIPAYPDRSPNQVMSAACMEHELPKTDSMSWKTPVNYPAA